MPSSTLAVGLQSTVSRMVGAALGLGEGEGLVGALWIHPPPFSFSGLLNLQEMALEQDGAPDQCGSPGFLLQVSVDSREFSCCFSVSCVFVEAPDTCLPRLLEGIPSTAIFNQDSLWLGELICVFLLQPRYGLPGLGV